MPTICIIHGMTIMMFYEDHDPPHFHVRHADFKAKFSIVDLSVIQSFGDLSAKHIDLVQDWGRKNQIALLENWFRSRQGEPILKIEA